MCQACLDSGSRNATVYDDVASEEPPYVIGCCKPDEGYYCVWKMEHMALVCEEWADICDLRKIIHQVRHIAFNVVSERQRARTALANLKKTAPFGSCKRFPFNKAFVNLSCGIYGTLWENLLSALDYKDRLAEKDSKFHRHGAESDAHMARDEYTLDDSKTQFRNTLKLFINSLCKRDEMFDRKKFEAAYELTWCTGKCPFPPGTGDPGEPKEPNEPPEKPPGKEPSLPGRIYGTLFKRLEDRGLDVQDYYRFHDTMAKSGIFRCGYDIYQLNPANKDLAINNEINILLVFTRGDYNRCNSNAVKGYAYFPDTGNLEGPFDLKVKFPGVIDFDDEYMYGLFKEFTRRAYYEGSGKFWSKPSEKEIDGNWRRKSELASQDSVAVEVSECSNEVVSKGKEVIVEGSEEEYENV